MKFTKHTAKKIAAFLDAASCPANLISVASAHATMWIDHDSDVDADELAQSVLAAFPGVSMIGNGSKWMFAATEHVSRTSALVANNVD
jgi:hypothetical protein